MESEQTRTEGGTFAPDPSEEEREDLGKARWDRHREETLRKFGLLDEEEDDADL